MRTWLACGGFVLAGCAGSAASSGQAPAPVAAGAADGAGECSAEIAFKIPDGWVDTGATVVAATRDKKLASVEGRARDGTVHAAPGPLTDETPMQEACRLGGAMVVLDIEARDEEPVVMRVIRPKIADEKADIALMCAGPPGPGLVTGETDAIMKRMIAFTVYRERVTSPRWRGWLFRIAQQAKTTKMAALDQLFAGGAAELRAAGAPADCWFVGALTGH
jgi:hypothetical protein